METPWFAPQFLSWLCCDRIVIGYVRFRAPSSWWSEAFGQDENTKQVHPTNFIHLELCVSSINHASFPIRVAPRAAHLNFLHIKVIVKHVRPMPANTVLAQLVVLIPSLTPPKIWKDQSQSLTHQNHSPWMVAAARGPVEPREDFQVAADVDGTPSGLPYSWPRCCLHCWKEVSSSGCVEGPL